jgi:hypothetical protein
MHLMHSSPEVAPTESNDTRGLRSPLERAVRLAFGDRERLRDERNHLAEENLRLASELKRLTDENEALRDAAKIWIRLYEKQLDRANRVSRKPATTDR